MDVEVSKAREEGKYCIIFDKHGGAQTFFSYKATLKDFHKEVIACQIGKKLKSQALETLRKGLIYAMRIGDTFVLNLDKTMPNLTTDYTSDAEFPT